MPKSKTRVFVGMSGGVDSSVAALLLKKEGYEITGVFMKNWADPNYPCPWERDRQDAMRVAALLDIPFQTWNFTEEYREAVVSYMIREYALGRTPNPDVMCNQEIKFGVFLKKALASGADFVATGHYVRRKGARLLEAEDKNKDQSYFLWTLTKNQLEHSLFPVGDYTKPEIRKIAKRAGLPTAEKPDSQGVCFVGEIDVAAFLRDHIPARAGKILTAAGKVVGEHDGVSFYTIGQRHGLGVGGGIPFYVAEKDQKTNTLIVAEGPNDNCLFKKELVAIDLNWMQAIELPLSCEARIRYRQKLQSCRVEKMKDQSRVRVVFKEEQRAVTPGQSIVFYRRGKMLGGGVIAEPA